MAYRNNPSNLERDYSKTGLTSPSDVYDIIKDNVEELSEFYEFEPAEVLEVLVDSNQLPTIEGPDGIQVPDYSAMGSIRATFLYSQSDGDEIEGVIRPLSSHIICYPLKGEIVNVVKHGGAFYYYNPLNLYGRVSVNRIGGKFGEGLVNQQSVVLNRPVVPRQGDLVLNGRFGQAIRFGSDPEEYKYPTIKITNNQSTKVQKLIDVNFPHRQNINADGSSINITSGPFNNDPLETATISNIYPSPSALPQYQGTMDGDMITINSDKLVFNAKGIPSENVNNGDIHMFAVRNINLNCNQSITLEVAENGVINLGEYKSINPVVKGIQTEELFKKLFKILSDFTKVASSVSGFKDLNDAATNLSEKLATLENNNLPRIFSNTVFITEDG